MNFPLQSLLCLLVLGVLFCPVESTWTEQHDLEVLHESAASGLEDDQLDAIATRHLMESRCSPGEEAKAFKPCCKPDPLGEDTGVALACDSPDLVCQRKNLFYGACVTEERFAKHLGDGWEGSVLECGELMTKGCIGKNDPFKGCP